MPRQGAGLSEEPLGQQAGRGGGGGRGWGLAQGQVFRGLGFEAVVGLVERMVMISMMLVCVLLFAGGRWLILGCRVTQAHMVFQKCWVGLFVLGDIYCCRVISVSGRLRM